MVVGGGKIDTPGQHRAEQIFPTPPVRWASDTAYYGMPFRWLTDLHLDHATPDAVAALHASLRRDPGVPVVLTGDLSTAPRLIADLEQLADAAGGPVCYVLGNHDHYGSSIDAVRDAVIALAERRPDISWLPPAGVVALAEGTVLVGVDGWADGRRGDPIRTPLVLNDDRLIEELATQSSRGTRLAVRRALADADAARLTVLLERAVATSATRIVVATHVPPFVEALDHRSRIAGPDWHPLLVCGAVGTVLTTLAQAHPAVRFEVLAGHAHASADVAILPNLQVRVGGARYGRPTLQSPG